MASTEKPRPSRWIGLFAGPLAAVVIHQLLAGQHGLTDPGRATLALTALMAIWWLTEALPIEATALVPLAIAPLVGVAPIARAAAPYADPVIFLFLGGMFLGAAMERWNLHRRIALRLILAVGTRPTTLILGVMIAAATLSMWVSNTATTIMMLPIGISIVTLIFAQPAAARATPRDRDHFAKAMMLAIAYAATIGGIATIIGTPPNAVAVAFIERTYGTEISFLQWMTIGLPLAAIFLPITWLVLTRLTHRTRLDAAPDVATHIRAELRGLGRMSRGEAMTAVVFALAATAWILREPASRLLGLYTTTPAGTRDYWLSDPGIAILAAILLFLLPAAPRQPVLDWTTAARVPWGVLLLFGGGLSLSAAVTANGVDTFLASQFQALGNVPTIVLILAITAVVVFATEVGSNTAIVNIFLPIAAALAITLGLHPYMLIVPVALAASYAFMMPMGTPPNALVFASGHLRIPDMARAGIILNILSIIIITALAMLLPRVWTLDRANPPLPITTPAK